MSVSTSNLNDKEKYFLIRLSYVDIPRNGFTANMSIEQFLDKAINNPMVDDKTLKEYKELKSIYDGTLESPGLKVALGDIRFIAYENRDPNQYNNKDGFFLTSNSGFVGYALQDTQGNRAMLYRGSEPGISWDGVADFADNLASSLSGESIQVEQAKQFYDKYKSHDGGNYLYGHSKGGNLASEVFVHNLGDDPQAYVVNGQPIYGDLTIEQQKALQSDKFTFIMQNGDVVSWLGFSLPYVDKIIKIDPNKLDPNKKSGFFGPHYPICAVFDKNGNLVIEENPYKNYKAQGAVGVFSSFTIASITIIKNPKIYFDILYGTALRYGKAAYEGLKNECIKIKEDFITGIAKLVNVTKDFIDAVHSWFDAVEEGVQQILKIIKIGVERNRGIVVEPYISVNTGKLTYYAQRLSNVQRQIIDIDRRMDSLYLKVGLSEIGNLLKADLMTGYNYRFTECINYLNKNAELLEAAENKLVRLVNSF